MTFKLKFDFEKRLFWIGAFLVLLVLILSYERINGGIIGYDEPLICVMVALVLILDFKDAKTKFMAKRGETFEGRIVGTTDRNLKGKNYSCRLAVRYDDTMLISPYVSVSQAERIVSHECTVWVNGDYAYVGEIEYKFCGEGINLPYK